MAKPPQVLLIDDNPLQLSLRETILRNAGFDVSIATTADSAMAVLRIMRERIGLIVTDHFMPACSGSEFVRQVRADNLWLPVIVLSGLADTVSEYEDLDVVFRTKPLPAAELIHLVGSLLAGARAHGAA
jgi:DNA-binding NtrC family response regulator